ncbi:MAG: phosphotransferase [Candidatus Coatesbacteria bacterium]|nr:MAG: phosphotransferase [Candidatus Coatesbacteria bacterium]
MNANLDKAKQDLARAYPELEVETIEFIGEGDFARAYAVNDELMILFALNPEGSEFLSREANLLPHFVKPIDIPIPDISRSGRYGDEGYTFICYPKIPGIPISAERFFDSAPNDQRRFAETISQFLQQLHSFNIEKARQAEIEERDYGKENRRHLEKSRELIYPLVDQRVRDYIEKIFDENTEPDFSPVLMHDDLSAEHILFDPERREITGIIDFSDMIIGDGIEDLMYLYDDFGVDFMDIFLEYYYDGNRRSLLERLHFYHECHTIGRILWAIENDYEPGVDFRLKELAGLVETSTSPAWERIIDSYERIVD